jgi:kynurenine formamidase
VSTAVSAAEFDALYRELSTWRRWGDDDERGAVNRLGPELVVEAARLVRNGTTVTLSWPLDTNLAAHNPIPADHHMTMLPEGDTAADPVRFAKDYIGLDYHGDTHTHVDALSHVAYNGLLYNGKPAGLVTDRGAEAESIEVLAHGLVGRGVLLDIPAVRGVSWLEPGEHVFTNDLEAAEREHAVTVREGDVVLVRTGHARRLREVGSWETAGMKAGLHPTAMPFVAERGVVALGSDGNNDTAPSTTERVEFPIHVLAVNSMGLYLFDYLKLEDLVAACARVGRFEFLFVAAPLRIPGGTGSPVNPLAIF